MHPFFGSAQQLCTSHLYQATLKVVSMLILRGRRKAEPNPTHAQKKTTRNSKASSSTRPPSVGTIFSSLKACQLQHVSCIVRKMIRRSQPQAVSPATSTGPISPRGRMPWVAAPQRTKKGQLHVLQCRSLREAAQSANSAPPVCLPRQEGERDYLLGAIPLPGAAALGGRRLIFWQNFQHQSFLIYFKFRTFFDGEHQFVQLR